MTHSKKLQRPKSLRESLSTLSQALGRASSLDMKSIRLSTSLSSKPPSSPSSPSSPVSPCSTFTTYRVRVYTKEGWNKYGYSEIPQRPTVLPKIEISPPDNTPIREPPPPACPQSSIRRSSAPAQIGTYAGYRRTVSMNTKKPLPPLPVQQSNFVVSELEAEVPNSMVPRKHNPETPPLSPAESFSIPERFPPGGIERFPTPPSRMPPSPPTTPNRTSADSLSWLSLELAIQDGEGGILESRVEEPWRPFLAFSPPTSPFSCVFPEDLHNKATAASEQSASSPQTQTLLTLPPEILIQIFSLLPTLHDMSTLAFSNSSLYNLFTANAMSIFTTSVRRSPALHDLLTFWGVYQNFIDYASAINQCLDTAGVIKSCIRSRCKNFLSQHLLSPQSAHQDHAFSSAIFNVWGFCARFSRTPGETGEQVSWLKSRGLGMPELRDMLEVYACLGVLLGPLTSDLSLAVKAGVVEDLGVGRKTEMEEGMDLWVVYLQMQDMEVIRPIIEVGEEDEAGRWDAVVKNRLAEWSRDDDNALRLFLKGAVGKVYAELSDVERRRTLETRWGVEGVWGETWEV
ncbi:hypothetical protein K440DRAFT_658723 [Wilcoxina mikolae CBS 423.85]|nr:hypothetical protein K440DRAFT_658723 [Wilcoxina mikolae CBS 423.85]